VLCNEGVLQNYARKWHIPIDKLDFEYEMLSAEEKTMLAQPTEGAYIYVRVTLAVLFCLLYRSIYGNK